MPPETEVEEVKPISSDPDLAALKEGADDKGKDDKEEEIPEDTTGEGEDEPVGEGEDTDDETLETEETEEEIAALSETLPSYKELKKNFPEIFQKVPGLKDLIFTHKAMAEVFPTVEDAKEASKIVGIYTQFEQSIKNGESDTLLDALKSAGDKPLEIFVGSFLPTLRDKNASLYFATVKPIITEVLRRVKTVGENNKDNNLINSASHISNLLFGSKDIPEDAKREEHPELKKLEEERNKDNRERMREFDFEVQDDVSNSLVALILKDMDPENAIPEFIRKSIVSSVISDVDTILSKDNVHKSKMNAIWKNVQGDIRNRVLLREHKSRLISAYLERVKALVPSIRKKYLSEAIGKMGKTIRKETRHVPSGNEPGRRPTKEVTAKEAKAKGMSDMDILMIGAKD